MLEAPSLAASVERLAERARAESWSHEEFLAACLQHEVAARESHGGEARIRHARFPAGKAIEDFDFDHQRSLKREVIAHLGTLDFVAARENVVFLKPPGTGKTHLSIGLGIRARQAGHRVAFATAAEWVAMIVGELAMHAWDLAVATGQRLELPADLLTHLHDTVFANVEQGRERGMYGPQVAVPADAPALDHILGLTGRDPAWA